MQIVHQSAAVSYSLCPAVLLLPAPPARLLITAPQIAGLLPAQCARHVEITLSPEEEFLNQIGPIRSREEMNAEIIEMMSQWGFRTERRQ